MARLVQNLPNGPLLLLFTCLKHQDVISNLCDDSEVVRDVQRRGTTLAHNSLEGPQHIDLSGHIQCGGGLIQNH